MTRSVFIICPVRLATKDVAARLEAYADMLVDNGVEVHLPHRDTNQQGNELEICMENAMAMFLANEIHIFYVGQSQGIHFDMGVAFALDQLCGYKKKIKLVSLPNSLVTQKQGFEDFIDQWIHAKEKAGEQEIEFEYEQE